MRKLIESTFVTLDGSIDRPQDWSGPYWDDEHTAYGNRMLFEADALLLGRDTYDVFAEAWPARSGSEYIDRINAMPKYVASRSLTEVSWNAQLLGEDVAAEVARIKQEPGDGTILKYGTGELDKTLLEHGLIDELHFWVFPVLAGGPSMSIEGLELRHLKLRDTIPFRSGIVVHVCTP